MRDLSIVIPARQEEWLRLTVEDALAHIEADTEIIVLLDGAWAAPPLAQHPRVQVVYLPTSIGQRAATNLGARLSTARYFMKADAHVAFGQGFDRKLIEAAAVLGPNVTQVPAQRNLHVYNQVCESCRAEFDQAPALKACSACGASAFSKRVVWQPRKRPLSTNWVFDSELHFQYDSNRRQVGDYPEIMSFLGACMFVDREHFLELGGFDEQVGSWGQFAQEWACKEWLSGGRVVCNRLTEFSHLFRVGGIGFPYPIAGSDQEYARQYSRNYWRGNHYEKQVHPMRWLVDKFWPVKGWTEAQRDLLPTTLPGRSGAIGSFLAAGGATHSASGVAPVMVDAPFSGSLSSVPSAGLGAPTDSALPGRPSHAGRLMTDGGKPVPSGTVGLPGVDAGEAVAAQDVDRVRGESKMGGVAAGRTVANDVVEDLDVLPESKRQRPNQPCPHDPVNPLIPTDAERGSKWPDRDVAVAGRHSVANPDPATGIGVDRYLGEQPTDRVAVEMWDGEILGVSHASASYADVGSGAAGVRAPSVPSILTKGLVFYTDNRLDPAIAEACRVTIERSGLPIVAVSLAPMRWPAARNIVLPLERGPLAMFRQILAGLEALNTDIAFLVEHDVAYHISHFAFDPPRRDIVYYNQHIFKVDADTGRALHYRCSQTSGLCADRQLLIAHYRRRVAHVERHGYSRRNGFEPGTRKIRHGGFDDLPFDVWMSEAPNVDIRHGWNLTPSRWRKDQFRNQKYTEGWTEGTDVPGWGVTAGRFSEFLTDVREGRAVAYAGAL